MPRLRRPGLSSSGAGLARPGPTAVPRPSGAFARASVNAVPTARPAPVTGRSSWRSGRSNASSKPIRSTAIRITNAAGTGNRRGDVAFPTSSVSTHDPIRPPVLAGPENLTSWNRPSSAVYASAIPMSVRPHGAPFSLPGPHSMYQPATSRTNGSSHRPAPKNGTIASRTQSVRRP